MSERPNQPDDPIPSELIRNDPSFADLVIDFVAGLTDRLDRLERAVQARDLETVRLDAHQLKGCGGGYGYPQLTTRATELERTAAEGSLEQCAAALEELRRLCQRIVVTDD